MDSILAISVSSIFSLIIAYLTASFRTRTELQQEKAKRELEISQQQKYNYFLPFKYLANEFGGRVKHIVDRLSEQGEKHDNMVKRFRVDLNNKDHAWFYNDSIGPHGGYFFTSTLYLNLLLFYWIKQIQENYPYIPLKTTNGNSREIREHNKITEGQINITPISNECEISDFIKDIKRFIGGENGIPYGLQDSFGDFMIDYSKGTQINYDEFCRLLMDKSIRVKFSPVINFWSNLIEKSNQPNSARVTKLKNLANLLSILGTTEIRTR